MDAAATARISFSMCTLKMSSSSCSTKSMTFVLFPMHFLEVLGAREEGQGESDLRSVVLSVERQQSVALTST